MRPYWQQGGVAIYCADVCAWAKEFGGQPAHALLCDPPYHLGEQGFMNQAWDAAKYGIAFQSETWAALAAHLLPGAFGMAFASTRGFHRMACAIEDAGLRIHPMIVWVNGQGFPKASRIDLAVDRAAGAENEREYLGPKVYADGSFGHASNHEHEGWQRPWKDDPEAVKRITGAWRPATDLARTWIGHRYGGQALKPALEPVCVFQAPYRGRPVDSITATGAGALNIDGGRLRTGKSPTVERRESAVRSGKIPTHHGDPETQARMKAEGRMCSQTRPEVYCEPRNGELLGRWPPNLVLVHKSGCIRQGTRQVQCNPDNTARGTGGIWSGQSNTPCGPQYGSPDGTEEVEVWACEPDCPVAALDEQSGQQGGGDGRMVNGGAFGQNGVYGCAQGAQTRTYADAGGASRFYMNCDWSMEVEERLADVFPAQYCAKAARAEREAGLEGMAVQANADWPQSMDGDDARGASRANNHPTVKPLALCKWLGTLLLPPAAYAPRRLLIPFAGTASEAVGAALAGWEEVILVEQSEEYCEIARKRLEWWMRMRDETGVADPSRLLVEDARRQTTAAECARKSEGQLSLW